MASDSVSLFGEGIISTALFERDLAINPKGTEIVYTLGDYKQSRRSLVVMRQENGEWTAPEILPFSGSKHHDIDLSIPMKEIEFTLPLIDPYLMIVLETITTSGTLIKWGVNGQNLSLLIPL